MPAITPPAGVPLTLWWCPQATADPTTSEIMPGMPWIRTDLEPSLRLRYYDHLGNVKIMGAIEQVVADPASLPNGVVWERTDLSHPNRFKVRTGGVTRNLMQTVISEGSDGIVSVLYRQSADSTAQAFATSEAIYNKFGTLGGGTLVVGSYMRYTVAGTFLLAALNTVSLTHRVRVGGLSGSMVFTSGAVSITSGVAALNGMFRLDIEIACRSVGATGTLVGSGSIWVTTGVDLFNQVPYVSEAIGVDTTIARDVVTTVQCSAAPATSSSKTINSLLEVV